MPAIEPLEKGTDLGRPFSEHLTTLVDVLRARARYQPDRVAYNFVDERGKVDASLTYAELDSYAAAVAVASAERVQTGQATASSSFFLLERISLPLFFGVLYTGATAVLSFPPDPSRLNRDVPRLERIVQDGKPTVALTSKSIYLYMKAKISLGKLSTIEESGGQRRLKWLARFKPLSDQLGVVEEVLVVSMTPFGTPVDPDEKAYRKANYGMCPPLFDGDSLAFLQYSSGSTGVPKGVMLTHKNLLYNSKLIGKGFETGADDVGVIWLPPYHDMGLIGGVIQPMYAGFPVYLLSPLTFLRRPMLWLQTISAFGGTISGGPNFSYDLCVRKSTATERKALNLKSWKVAFSGAEPVWEKTLSAFNDAFGVSGFDMSKFYPCYGLAESTLIVSGGKMSAPPTIIDCPLQKEGEEEKKRRVSCGWALDDGMHIKIVDPDTFEEKREGEEGEIWVNSPSNAVGYWQMREESEEVFNAHLSGFGDVAYMRTGDLGFVHDSELYISGRIKDLIIIRGRNHYPQDIEKTIEQSHAELRPGCLAAFSIEKNNEEHLALVAELRDEVKLDKIDVASFLKSIRSAVSQNHTVHLHTIALIKSRKIPKTTSGKIRRRMVKDMLMNNEYGKDLLKLDESKAGGQRPAAAAAASGGAGGAPPAGAGGEGAAVGGGGASEGGAGEGRAKGTSTLSREELLAIPTESGRVEKLIGFVMGQVADLMGVDASEQKVDPNTPLLSLGLDSLMVADVKGGLEYDLRITIAPEALAAGDGPSARSLAMEALKEIAREGQGGAAEGTTANTDE
eukprot:CAMPEP_0113905466 /NCGR_PEP_ID=MMETSP0780_2-20120614/24034_1 /TAXON_ID=652834 /ORGANISM="Palpitomonas bilix" /LENGTH=791 /DNA_ID=CAMNT_0000899611 /DNA_START=71 /DNA_END=2448 /DNA_ORIENTATION=- /assembly_acc=CAM_ASM_000599